MPSRGERLRVAAALLAAPEDDALDVVAGLGEEHVWLGASGRELASIPLDEWQAEHARLFICGHPRTVCPPYASAFRDGHTFGPASDDIAAFYRRVGLEAVALPPDYLGTMLECAAWLSERQETGQREFERELWQKHLHGWLPRFAETLVAQSRLDLYRSLGKELNALYEEMEND
jgi:putative dimethyl sulfoxide reductase chaperone